MEKLGKIRESVEKERGIKVEQHSLAECLTRSILFGKANENLSLSVKINDRYKDANKTTSKTDQMGTNAMINPQFNHSVEVDQKIDKKVTDFTTVSHKLFYPNEDISWRFSTSKGVKLPVSLKSADAPQKATRAMEPSND
jgi:hypothetical protein